MNIITDSLVNFNVKYWDIRAAGPTVLNELYGINLLDKEKEERNILYGKLQKQNAKIKIIPKLLLLYSELIAKRNKGILYTLDSVITRFDIRKDPLVESSYFTYHLQYDFQLIVISRRKNGYIGLTKKNEVVIKGEDKHFISKKIAFKLLTTGISNLEKFKQWFKRCSYKNFVVDNKLVLNNKIVEIKSDYDFEPNREFYWIKILPYVYAISAWRFELY